jgi:hypothetical protein
VQESIRPAKILAEEINRSKCCEKQVLEAQVRYVSYSLRLDEGTFIKLIAQDLNIEKTDHNSACWVRINTIALSGHLNVRFRAIPRAKNK